MFKLNRRRGIALGIFLSLAITAGAYAYWTAGGSGTGSASTQAATTALTANQTGALTPMYPGDSAQSISGDFDNPNNGPIYVTSVTVSIASVTGGDGPGCDATDYTLSSATMAVGAQVPAGNGVGSFSGATIQFNNKAGSNQDDCKGATVNLAFSVS